MKYLFIDGFEFPEILLFAFLFFIGIGIFYSRKKPDQNFLEIELLKKIYKKNSYYYMSYLGIIYIMSILFFIALARPYISGSQETVKKNGIDIEIVFDLSSSMLAQDMSPNRLEVAKKVFSDFVSGLETDRVGLVLFSGKAFGAVPLSYDYEFLKDYIEDISIENISQGKSDLQGTAIGDGLILASDTLSQDDSEREKIIILITDGEANRGIKPEIALKLLKEKGIRTYTIGVGKDKETTMRFEIYPGIFQNSSIGAVDETILKKIARETSGEYFRANSQETFSNILEIIGKIEKKEIEVQIYSFHKDQTYIILSIILALFLPLGWIIFFKKIHL